MANIKLSHIYKVYENGEKKPNSLVKPAVSDFSLEIEDKEFVVFVGPSGCGKSTTLRMIAGLEDITSGELYIDDVLVNDVEPKDRNISMVFQNYALYPHMTVYQNIAYGLKLKKYSKDYIHEKVMEAAKMLDIEEYLERKPKALSGGQRQRVALGRALVRNPKVFLLDEPLSNLDAKLRSVMRAEITKLHNKVQTTFVYVTHDQVEAMTMGTKIVVMKDGFIQQVGSPQFLYDNPSNKFVAGFIGTPQMNFYKGKLHADGSIEFANNRLKLSPKLLERFDSKYFEEEKEVYLGIRPEDLSLTNDAVGDNVIKSKVDFVEKLGSEALLHADLDLESETSIIAKKNDTQIVAKVEARCNVSKNSLVNLAVNMDCIHLFDYETENSISVSPIE